MVMRSLAVLFLLLSLAMSSCGGSGTVEISGTVTFAGNPIEKGNIQFTPSADKGPLASTLIKDGRYSVEVMPGPKLVRIEGFKVLGQKKYIPSNPSSPMIDITEPIVPARYNKNSNLTCEITPNEKNYNFDLK